MATTALEIERAALPRAGYRRLLLTALMLVAALVLGGLITYVTLILPRHAELSRVRRRSPFFQSIDLAGSLKRIAPNPSGWTTQNGNALNAGGKQTLGRWMVCQGTVPPAQQSNLVSSVWNDLLFGPTPSGRPIIWSNGSFSNSDGDGMFHHNYASYRNHGVVGVIHLIAQTRGDHVRFLLIIDEQ